VLVASSAGEAAQGKSHGNIITQQDTNSYYTASKFGVLEYYVQVQTAKENSTF